MLTNHINGALDVGQSLWTGLCHDLTSDAATCVADTTLAFMTRLPCRSGHSGAEGDNEGNGL
jgi:hypothetical protein